MEPQETNEINTPETVQTAEITKAEHSQDKKQSINIAAAIITGAAMIALALVLILHPKAGGTTTQQQPTTPTTIPANIATLRPTDTDHVRGDLSQAQILIFEYSDSDCPFCVKFHPTLQQVVSDYKGKVAWVYRFFPLSIHPDAYNEAVALQCAGQLGGAKAFNSYLDSAINVTLNPDPTGTKMLTTMATAVGIDGAKFNTCLTDPATATSVQNSMDEAQSIGAQGTPFSVIVNIKTGKQMIIPGAYPLADVEKDIDSLLK